MNEIMSKPPEGYRESTPEEAKEFQDLGNDLRYFRLKLEHCDAEIQRAQSEIELWKLRKQQNLSQFAVIQQKAGAIRARFGIEEGDADAVKEVGGKIYFREKGTTKVSVQHSK